MVLVVAVVASRGIEWFVGVVGMFGMVGPFRGWRATEFYKRIRWASIITAKNTEQGVVKQRRMNTEKRKNGF